MIRFVHTADIHFGMENYGRIDAKTGIHTRLLDFERALNFCVDYAVEQKVDFFLFAGDAYKTANPTPTHQRLFMQCFLKLYKAGIPIVMVVGNHDNPLSFGKAHALEIFGQLPVEGFHVISKPQTLVLTTKNGPVQIVGIPWPTRNTAALSNVHAATTATELTQYISTGVSRIIQTMADELDKSMPAVLCGHLTVSSGIFSGSEKRAVYGTDPLFFPSQLAIEPFDYVALGHLHRFQNLNKKSYPPIIYSGSLERIDFGERKEDKGFCSVSLKAKGDTQYEFVPTPTRPFIQVEVDLDGLQNQTDQILTELAKHDLQAAVVKILYHIPVGCKDRVDLNAIQQACVNAMYLVGIIPLRTLEVRERRAALKVDMNLSHLLGAYFDTKPEHKGSKESLIEKALLLELELKDSQETGY
ncbi:exonuclease SbcCD subunit D [Candidatus Dependentiae bacterium]|nr:exonuclease SbcCD subunit D [Candidatus Dependentiae bacterium]